MIEQLHKLLSELSDLCLETDIKAVLDAEGGGHLEIGESTVLFWYEDESALDAIRGYVAGYKDAKGE